MVTSGGVTLSGTVTTLKSGAKLYTDESVTFTMPTRTVTVEAVYTYHTGVKVGNTTWAAYNMQDFNVGVNTAYNMFADAPYTYGSLYQFDRLWGWDPNQKATPQNGNTSISSTAVRRWDNQGPSFNSYDIWYAANNPCPSGWTVPNLTQYSELLDKADYGWHARRTGEVFIVNQSSGRKLAIHFPAGYFFDMTSGNKYSDSAHMTRYITQTRGGYTNGVRNWYSFVFLRPNSPTTAWLDSTVHANAPYIPSDKHTIGAGSALRCVAGAK
ncbi:MAG: hypothetical protein LBU97_04435 [Alistipes sp.]|jgi:uncharacterized protein (TIGR02145 family)|nr:hypothetical protein [Alistipes sp.]